MAALTVQSLVLTGATPTYAAAAGGGDTFVNTGDRTFVWFKNSGIQTTVTFDDVGSVLPAGGKGGATFADVDVVVLATTGDKIVGPFPVSRFGTVVAMTYTQVTGITVGAFTIP